MYNMLYAKMLITVSLNYPYTRYYNGVANCNFMQNLSSTDFAQSCNWLDLTALQRHLARQRFLIMHTM